MHRASIVVLVALLGGCAGTLPDMRPQSSGFAGGGSVLHPLEDGKRHLAEGRNGLAIRRFGEELGRHPRSLDALNGIAIAYAGLGRHDVAQTYFERALVLDARNPATLNNYGRSLVDQRRLREARPFLEQALRYAAEIDVPIIAANVLSIREAAPPAVLTATREEAPRGGPKLVRIAADRYQLQTIIPAAGPTEPIRLAASRPAPLTNAPITMVELLPLEPGPAAGQALQATPAADPPLADLEPGRPEAAVEEPRPAEVAPRPVPASRIELATIRATIEQRITGTGFEQLLDDILSERAPGAALFPIEEETWT